MKYNIGDNIRHFRIKNRLSQAKLSEMLHISSQAVSRWEHNICYPDMDLLPEIAEILNISIQDLFLDHTDDIDRIVDKVTEHYYNKEKEQADKILHDALAVHPENIKLLYTKLFLLSTYPAKEKHKDTVEIALKILEISDLDGKIKNDVLILLGISCAEYNS